MTRLLHAGGWFMALATLCVASAAAASAAQAVRTILLVRHGAYDEAAADNAHAHLLPLGAAQARLVATRLRTLSPAELVSSTLTRAEETAAIIATELPSVPEQKTDLLRECTPPVLPSVKLDPEERRDSARCKGQLDSAFATYFKPAFASETDILVCHGNVIRYLVTKALGVDTRLWTRFSVGHTSITEIRIRPDGTMQLIAIGDVGHLPEDMQSGSGQATPSLEPPAAVP